MRNKAQTPNTGLAPFGHLAPQDKIFLTLKSGFAIKNIVRNPNERQAWERYTQGVAPTAHRTATKINGQWHRQKFFTTANTQKENLVFLPALFLKRKQMPTHLYAHLKFTHSSIAEHRKF